MSVPEHRARGDSEVIGGVPASLSPLSVPDCTDRAEPALLAVAALAALAEEAAPLRPAEDVEATLRDVEEMADQRGLKWTSEAREGDPADVLVDLAEAHDADVLVIGNKGMQRRVLGSVPNSVSHKAKCSVMIVKTT